MNDRFHLLLFACLVLLLLKCMALRTDGLGTAETTPPADSEPVEICGNTTPAP